MGISWHHNPSAILEVMLLSCVRWSRERSGSCECREMEGARGPLLGVECELRVGLEILSSGVECEFGVGPETLSFRVECKFGANPLALSSGSNVSSGRTPGLSLRG